MSWHVGTYQPWVQFFNPDPTPNMTDVPHQQLWTAQNNPPYTYNTSYKQVHPQYIPASQNNFLQNDVHTLCQWKQMELNLVYVLNTQVLYRGGGP